MTAQKPLKRRVRARMAKTGERYTAARRQILSAATPQPADRLALPAPEPTAVPEPTSALVPTPFRGERTASDEAVSARTKRPWADWLALLNGWGAAQRPHPEIARWLSAEHGVDSWWAQELTVRYEMAIGRRRPGERADGFSITSSKTIAVPVSRLFTTFVDADAQAQWLPGIALRLRTSTPDRSARFDFPEGESRLAVGFTAKGDARSTVALQHERLADADTAARMKQFWRERLTAIQQLLEE